jgi:5-methylcytosine-specific restriction protein A
MGKAVEITDEVPVRIRWQLRSACTSQQTAAKNQRLPASEFDKLRPEHIWEAGQLLIAGYADHPFSPSTDYDVVTDEGNRLPPKTVFGIAAKLALGFGVGPAHFTAGVKSQCFRTIEDAGFRIAPNSEQPAESPPLVPDDQYWTEGNKKLTPHMKKERSPAASRAKKSQFKALHGKLFCEKCGLVPAECYETAHAESCIEVHHRYVQAQDTTANHRTTLDSLQCLCANCHRLEHKLLKMQGF